MRDERGVALVLALMAVALLSALGFALAAMTSTELLIAANYRNGQEALYAADAVAERGLADLASVPGWDEVFDGSSRSTFIDGPPSGARKLPDGTTIDLTEVVDIANCGKTTTCTAAELTASGGGTRPWGANNPVWRLYAYGRLASLLPPGAIDSPFYAVLLVGDDPSETDDDPLHDGADPAANPGTGVIALRAEAFGPRAAHKVIELTAARADTGQALRLLSWREVR
jgi:type IV pilus assembly PilX-like protein